MGRITSVSDIRQLGTILGVWAHPDDETFTSAGIMTAAVRNGQEVICVTATKGERGMQDESKWPAHQLANVRKIELEAALKTIGVKKHHWLDFKDNCCDEAGQDGVLCICELIDTYQPDTILTFGHDGMTGHDDHKAVCMWAVEAQKRTNHSAIVYHAVITKEQHNEGLDSLDKKLNIFFNLSSPNLVGESDCHICFRLTPELQDIKYAALQAMPSQTTRMFEEFGKDVVCDALSTEAFVKANNKTNA